ncbi:MAG: hypothetical protein IPI93_06030 [Sphingobacteriaceae bacterium]|nr:hypothetical protein [Sphingobacteriaceae bacterium]
MTQTKDPFNKECLYSACKKQFTAKRRNQEYCCSECKKKANNGKASNWSAMVKKILVQHKINWQVLHDLFSAGHIEVAEQFLMANKFNHSKPTGIDIDKEGYLIPEFYNYALERIGENKFKIIKLW